MCILYYILLDNYWHFGQHRSRNGCGCLVGDVLVASITTVKMCGRALPFFINTGSATPLTWYDRWFSVCVSPTLQRWPSCRPFLINVNRPASNAVPSTDIGNRLLSNGVLSTSGGTCPPTVSFRLPVVLVLQRCPFDFRWCLFSNFYGVPSTPGGNRLSSKGIPSTSDCNRPSCKGVPSTPDGNRPSSKGVPSTPDGNRPSSKGVPSTPDGNRPSSKGVPSTLYGVCFSPSNDDVPYLCHPLNCTPV